ncbi:hypothetical protein [Helicobacter bilis]|uniref:hypothetical protein n=1 Tax=Helicobacter bilis TaxID=37372 RepID=UPI002557E02D|nr:hypothetical protein [Helicobacter bilis]
MNDRCKYHYLYNYCTHTRLDIKDYTKIGLDSNPSNATILTLHTPYKAQKLEITLANGLDSILESKDRQRQAKLDREYQKSHNNTKQQSIDSLLTITLINDGYKGKLWGFSAMPHLCPHSKHKDFFLAMIYLSISQIQNLAFLLHY